MGFYDSDMIYKAGPIYKGCCFCGKREFLKLRKASTFNPIERATQSYFSIRCEDCKLTFGEVDGEPVYESESDLIAAWNRRKY